MIYISINPDISDTRVVCRSQKDEQRIRRSQGLKDRINALRKMSSDEYSKKKIYNWYRLPNGFITGEPIEGIRKNEYMTANNRMLLDIDHCDPQEVYRIFTDLGMEKLGVCHFEISPSGQGAHIDVRRMEGLTMDQNITYYEYLTGLHFDHLKDLSRACFLVPESDVLYCTDEYYEAVSTLLPHNVPDDMNLDSAMYTTSLEDVQTTSYSRTYSDDADELISLIDKVYATGIDITPTYDAWYRLGFCISHILGSSGVSYFQKISSLYPNYDARECYNKYFSLLRDNKGLIGIGTFVWLAREFGAM